MNGGSKLISYGNAGNFELFRKLSKYRAAAENNLNLS